MKRENVVEYHNLIWLIIVAKNFNYNNARLEYSEKNLPDFFSLYSIFITVLLIELKKKMKGGFIQLKREYKTNFNWKM